MKQTQMNQHTGQGTSKVLLLGLIVGLLAFSQVAKAQTFSNERIIINDDFTASDVEILFYGRDASTLPHSWTLKQEKDDQQFYFNYAYNLFGSGAYNNDAFILNGEGRYTVNSISGQSAYGAFTVDGSTMFRVGLNTSNQGFVYNQNNAPILFGTNATERMRLDASGNLLIGATGTASGLLHVNGTSYMDNGIIFGNTEGANFGAWDGSVYTTNPTEATLIYDANWEHGTGGEYPVASYFVDGTGNDDDIGGFAFWGGNVTKEWEHILTTYNMRYLVGDVYSMDVEAGLNVGGDYTSTSGNITTTNGTITGNALSSTTTLTTGDDITMNASDNTAALYLNNNDNSAGLEVRLSGNSAYLWNETSGGILFGSDDTERMRLRTNGQLAIGSNSFNSSSLAQLGVEGTFHATDSSTIGTATTDANLTVFGTAFVKNLYIDKNEAWADYVFEEGYELRSLTEVESFIAENGHLPDVMSAEEVATQGYAQTEVNETLLRKIEELTLYSIDLEKARAEQATTNAAQQDKINALEASNAELRVMLETILTQLDQE
ncbi:MAG: hypothetical protein AAFQ98_02260 [Bacteroidota bacterium]